jgi:hypothetical protein
MYRFDSVWIVNRCANQYVGRQGRDKVFLPDFFTQHPRALFMSPALFPGIAIVSRSKAMISVDVMPRDRRLFKFLRRLLLGQLLRLRIVGLRGEALAYEPMSNWEYV